MKAFVYEKYGNGDNLELREVARPVPGDTEVLVKVYATSLNASDWELLTGKPLYARLWGYIRPKIGILGSDIAGRIESVGANVSRFYPGDEVFGDSFGSWGGFADYACIHEARLLRKPSNMTFNDVAALPQAGVVALQGLRDKGLVQPGKNVLIIGAGGGAGTYAIQLAKLFGATVTAVDSFDKLDLMRSLGADHVIDYSEEDFAQSGLQYDLVLDLVGKRSIFLIRRILAPGGIHVLVGGTMFHILQSLVLGPVLSAFGDTSFTMLAHRQNQEDIEYIKELCLAGTLKSSIDREYRFKDIPDALRYLGAGEALGKVVVTAD